MQGGEDIKYFVKKFEPILAADPNAGVKINKGLRVVKSLGGSDGWKLQGKGLILYQVDRTSFNVVNVDPFEEHPLVITMVRGGLVSADVAYSLSGS